MIVKEGSANVTNMDAANQLAHELYQAEHTQSMPEDAAGQQAAGELPPQTSTEGTPPQETQQPEAVPAVNNPPQELENRQLREQLARAQQIIQEMQQANTAQQAQMVESGAETPQPTADEFFGEFYENPLQAITKLISPALKAEVNNEIGGMKHDYEMQQSQIGWANAISDIAGKHNDFGELEGDIANVISANPYLRNMDKSQAIETAYLIAKGQRANSAPSLEQQLSSDEVLQGILNNPEIAKKIALLQSRMQSAAAGNIPPMTASGGLVSATPNIYDAPKNVDDADRLARKQFGLL